jgi:hypothetical protein
MKDIKIGMVSESQFPQEIVIKNVINNVQQPMLTAIDISLLEQNLILVKNVIKRAQQPILLPNNTDSTICSKCGKNSNIHHN